MEVKGGSWVVTMRLLKVSGRPLPKAMSISRSEIFREKKEKSGPEVEKLSSVMVLESVHYQKQ